MALNLDDYLGIHAKSLMVREQRTAQIANNMANLNTPGYKAQDIDFNQTLAQAMTSNNSTMVTDKPNHIQGQTNFSTQLKYRVSGQTSLDGNTVDKDLETTEFSRNALGYQASLAFLDNKIKSLMTALKGE